MTINPKTFELRNLLGKRPDDVKQSCGVCGKPHATLTKAAKELPLHKRAIAEDWAGNFRNLTKALGDKLVNFAGREVFNAQLEQYRQQLTDAREEHDNAPAEEIKSRGDKEKIRETLGKTLDLLGIKHGELKLGELVDRLHEEVGILVALKADSAA